MWVTRDGRATAVKAPWRRQYPGAARSSDPDRWLKGEWIFFDKIPGGGREGGACPSEGRGGRGG